MNGKTGKTKIRTDGGCEAEVDSDVLDDCRVEIMDALSDGAGYGEIEDILSGDLGLEMDYLADVIGL